MEQHFGTQQHQTGLDEVFHLGAVLDQLGRADGIGDDHADGDGPDLGVDAVQAHGLLVAQDIGQHAEGVDDEEGDEELAGVHAHEHGTDGAQGAQHQTQHDEGGDAVEGLGQTGSSLGGLLLGALPGVDGGLGGIIQTGILITGSRGGILGGLGRGQSLGSGLLGSFDLGLEGGVALIRAGLIHHQGIQRIVGPAGGRLQISDDISHLGLLLGLHVFLGGSGLVPFDGLEGLAFLSLDDGLVFVELGFQGRTLAKAQPCGHDQEEEADPDGPVVFLLPQVGPLRLGTVDNDFVVLFHNRQPPFAAGLLPATSY